MKLNFPAPPAEKDRPQSVEEFIGPHKPSERH